MDDQFISDSCFSLSAFRNDHQKMSKILIKKAKILKEKNKEIVLEKPRKYLVQEISKDFHCKEGIILKKDLKKKIGTKVKTNIGKEFTLLNADFMDIYKKIKRVEINPLNEEEMLKIAQKILRKEGITGLKKNILETIIKKNHGDLRGVINDLQGISQGSFDSDDLELILSLTRDSNEEIFKLIRDLFTEVTTLKEVRALTNRSDVDYNSLYKWVNENLPTFIKLNDELSHAYENLSIADSIFGRIQVNQYWSLLPYFYDLFAGGTTLARKKGQKPTGYRRIRFPRYTSRGYFSLNAAQTSLTEKIQEKYQASQKEIMGDLIPFLKILSKSSRKLLKVISDWLELEGREKKLLA